MSSLTCNRCQTPGITVFRREALCGRCAARVAEELRGELAAIQTHDRPEPEARHPLAPGPIDRSGPAVGGFVPGVSSTTPGGTTVRANPVAIDTLSREGLTVDEMRRYLTSVDRQRQSDDQELDESVGTLLPDDEARRYQTWVESIRRQDDAETGALLSHIPEGLQ